MEDSNKKNWITITKELEPSSVRIPKVYEGCIESVLIQEKDIKARIKDLTTQIANHYGDRPFIPVVVLKGSFLVFTEIYQNLMDIYSEGIHNNKIVPEFIRMKNIKSEAKMNEVIMKGVDELEVEGKEVLIIEDIIESGDSLRHLLKVLKERKNPKDVKIFSLVVKQGRTNFEFPVDYVGFEIPDKFCVGYGIDYNEKFRDLYSLCVINQHGLDKYKA